MHPHKYRFSVDTGGTFTDLAIEDETGQIFIFKSHTTPNDPVIGVLDVFRIAAGNLGLSLKELLGQGEYLIYGTTFSVNAILTKNTARTAFLTTQGHPDILVLRGGGRLDAFDFTTPFPEPYVPRSLTFEVPERIRSDGKIVLPLDEEAVIKITSKLREINVEAVGVCLLWSMINPAHEHRVGELLRLHLPGIPYTLSHQLNPIIREYRRASSTCIDASLKPVMSGHLRNLENRLREENFCGRLLMITSSGGIMDAAAVADAPIHSIGSGPAVAPVSGRYFAQADCNADTAIIADTGGTSYDVSLVRQGRIPQSRDTWIGPRFLGHITGFSSVDVKSIGAGGGSIAWVDEGGLLHVGPQSAGAVPGPICYQRGGTKPTVTDACLVLGYIDPNFFLGGSMKLNLELAQEKIMEDIAVNLHMDVFQAASAIVTLATEHMVGAIEDITIKQGIDPRSAVLIGGGGAAGLNSVVIARRLQCPKLIIPDVGAVLSAAGGLMSDLLSDYISTYVTTSSNFNFEMVNRILDDLGKKCQKFIEGPGAGSKETNIEFTVEARYPRQVWELELPLRISCFMTDDDVEQLRQDFHHVHQEVFAIQDPVSAIELVTWHARVRCRIGETVVHKALKTEFSEIKDGSRRVYFPGIGMVEATVRQFENLLPGETLFGPAIVESPITTIVIDAEARVERTHTGSLLIYPNKEYRE
jgi:N-methylhydantoinase A